MEAGSDGKSTAIRTVEAGPQITRQHQSAAHTALPDQEQSALWVELDAGRPGCPHLGCEHVSACDTAHIVWKCPATQKVWTMTTAAWRGLGTWTTTHNGTLGLNSIFSLSFPATPPALRRTKHMMAINENARRGGDSKYSPDSRRSGDGDTCTATPTRHSLTELAVAGTLRIHNSRLRGVNDALRSVSGWDDPAATARTAVL